MPNAKDIPGLLKSRAKAAVGTDLVLVDLIHAIKSEIVGKLDALQLDLNSASDSISEEVAMLGTRVTRSLDAQATLERLARANNAELVALRHEMAMERGKVADGTSIRLDTLDRPTAYFLNYANSHRGPLADRNLWINNPVVIEWDEGDARVGAVNERIVEVPYVLQALGSLKPGAEVLDIGGGESTVGLSLASLGYQTTVVEPQGYPFQHPNLEVLLHPLEDIEDRSFDAIVLLSTIEHFGIGHYQGGPEPDISADRNAIEQIATMLKPGGILVLTVPYGPSDTNDLERIYDRDRLVALLDGWAMDNVRVGRREDSTTWVHEADELIDPPGPGRVAMLVAQPNR